MDIKKKWLSLEEFEQIQGGSWTPEAHTHIRSEVVDLWNSPFWDNIPDKPSSYIPAAHNILSTYHGDTLAASVVRGDLMVGNSTPKWSRLAKGASGTYLRSNGTDPSWSAIQAGDLPSHTHARASISDFWGSPFWDNIPDKPATFPPSSHNHDERYYTETEIDTKLAMQDTLAEMDDVQLQTLSDGHFLMYDADLSGGKWTNKTLSRSDISDFWDSPFWANIPDKPSTFDPVVHTLVGAKHTASGLTAGQVVRASGSTTFAWAFLDWDDIANKPSTFPPSSHTHDDRYYTETELNNGQLDSRYYTESEVNTKLAMQDTLAEMDDVQLQTLSDEQVLVYDADLSGGKWTNKTLTVGPHATQHESGGSDEIDFNQIKGFSDYLNQAVKTSSNPTFNSVYLVNTDTRIAEGNYNMPRLITPIGYVDVGVSSVDNYAHIDTGATRLVVNQSPYYLTYKIWHENNDGPGSGLNACLVDGEHAADIVTNARVKAHFPDTIANILSNHTKAVHDALNINADTWDTHHLPTLVAGKFLSNNGSSLSWETPAGGGGADLQFRAYRNSTSQSVGAGATVKVEFNAENYDTDSKYDHVTNYRYSPATAGYYNITATIYTYLNSAKVGIIYLYKNGVEVARWRWQVAQSAYFSFTVYTHLYLTSSEYLEVWYYNGDASNRDIYAGSNQTWFSAYQFA